MTMRFPLPRRSTSFAIFLAAAATPFASGRTPALGQDATGQRPVLSLPQAAEAGREGAKVYNFYSENGKIVRELGPGEVVIVRGTHDGGMLQVEIPGGFPCFVHSDFAEAGEKPGTILVKASGVNLRPAPSSSPDAYPIGQVGKGTVLRLLEVRPDRWYRVLSPPDFTAWVSASSVTLLGPPEGQRARIEAAAAAVENEWKPVAERMAKDLESQKNEKAASDALAKGDRLLTGLAANWNPATAADARAAFQEAAAKSGEAATKTAVKERIDKLEALEKLEREQAAARELAEKHAETSRKAAADMERKAEELRLAKDASGPRPNIARRFAAIGWIQRQNAAPISPLYRLEKGGIDLFQLACPSGRYDLDSFLGKEIGIQGKILENEGRVPKTLVIERIEILSN
jgi:hypothetical protein